AVAIHRVPGPRVDTNQARIPSRGGAPHGPSSSITTQPRINGTPVGGKRLPKRLNTPPLVIQ
ncbi:MAG: hypothetical protein ACK56I_36750, partial [bacterium]